MRNCNEGIERSLIPAGKDGSRLRDLSSRAPSSAAAVNSYMKDHLGLETHINGKGVKNIDLHVTECCIAILAVALTRLQHGIKASLSSVAYLT